MTEKVMGINYPLSLAQNAFVRHEAEMFAHNTIEGLVHFDVIHRKSRHEIYPHIDRMVPLSRYIKGEQLLGGGMYHLLLRSICRAVHSCEVYLLEPENICFSTAGTYIDDEGFSFIYMPGVCDDSNGTGQRTGPKDYFHKLTEYVDGSDEDTVNLHHRLRFLLEQHGDEQSLRELVTAIERECTIE